MKRNWLSRSSLVSNTIRDLRREMKKQYLWLYILRKCVCCLLAFGFFFSCLVCVKEKLKGPRRYIQINQCFMLLPQEVSESPLSFHFDELYCRYRLSRMKQLYYSHIHLLYRLARDCVRSQLDSQFKGLTTIQHCIFMLQPLSRSIFQATFYVSSKTIPNRKYTRWQQRSAAEWQNCCAPGQALKAVPQPQLRSKCTLRTLARTSETHEH